MAGYTKNYSKANGELIDVADAGSEFTLISSAFDETTGHLHDGTADNGAPIPLLAEATLLSAIDVTAGQIVLSIEDTAVKVGQLVLTDGLLKPVSNNDVDLGTTVDRFKDTFTVNADISGNADVGTNLTVSALTQTTALVFDAGVQVNTILDEDTLATDSVVALATQQSIKAYVDATVSASKNSSFTEFNSPLSLTGALATYTTANITVKQNSSVIISVYVEAEATLLPGRVEGRIRRDTTLLGVSNFLVLETRDITGTEVDSGSTGYVFKDETLAAGTYTYKIDLQDFLTTGTALYATLLIQEELA